jgi:hypothetical protein
MKSFLKTKIVLILIMVLAACFRLYGLDWDQGQHLHPDERFLTMVAATIKIPSNLKEYLNPQISSMNPYNVGYNFFVYGTFPLNLTKVVGVLTGNNEYGNIHFVGRILSAFFDIGVVFLVFKIGQKIHNEKVGLLTALLYSIMVLPIQLSHFFAVDTFLNFFIVLSFYFLIKTLDAKYLILNTTFLGVSFGLALACKISALYFLPIIGLGFIFLFFKHKNLKSFIVHGSLFLVLALITFRLAQPSAFLDTSYLIWKPNPKFTSNLKELRTWGNFDSWFPPDVYWMSRQSIFFPLKNLIFWGVGLPIGITTIVSFVFLFFRLLRKTSEYKFTNFLILIWAVGLFVYQGLQFAKNMRYFLPIYPFLALISANFLSQAFLKLQQKLSFSRYFSFALIFIYLIYPLSFMSIYAHKNTRVIASEWIYQNITPGSTIACEHWDDCLPVNLPDANPGDYLFTEGIPLYNQESPEKWEKVNNILQSSDYIVLSSSRLHGSIPLFPKRYPKTKKYYEQLFDGSLGFEIVTEFSSRPCFPPTGKPWFCFNDDQAEETFTVYDHPKVTIFKKTTRPKLESVLFDQL